MKKNIQVLFVNALKIDIQEIIQLFEDVEYHIISSCININEFLSDSNKANSYDLLIIDTSGMREKVVEIGRMLDKLKTETPIIIIANNKKDKNYYDNLNYLHIECLLRKDIHFIGVVAKHLLIDTFLQKRTTYIQQRNVPARSSI